MHRFTLSLPLALLLIAVLEFLLLLDVRASHRGALHTEWEVQAVLSHLPATPERRLARWTAINFTALIWPAYILLLHGLLSSRGTSPIRSRPHHFALLCLASVPLWCLFDFINFYFINSWNYLGIPPSFLSRFWGYLLAFASITPAMLLTAQFYQDINLFRFARFKPQSQIRNPQWILLLCLLIGLAMFLFPFLHPDPVTNLTLWTSLVFLLDPINFYLNRPSIFGDWLNGSFSRTLSLFAGGLTCGLLWEFWNYWSLAKWTYHLPFLGSLEHYKYFEMPLPGLLGFLPFALESWIMWQLLRIPFDGLAEKLPNDQAVL